MTERLLSIHGGDWALVAREHQQEIAYNLRRAFPVTGRGEFDDLLAALDRAARMQPLDNKNG